MDNIFAAGDTVALACDLYMPDGARIEATTLGTVTRQLPPGRVAVDFGDGGTHNVNVAALDLVEMPDGLDLSYLGDTALEFALRACEAYLNERELVAAYVTIAINSAPVMCPPILATRTNGHRETR